MEYDTAVPPFVRRLRPVDSDGDERRLLSAVRSVRIDTAEGVILPRFRSVGFGWEERTKQSPLFPVEADTAERRL